ncbi:hypothetical protein FQA47_019782 [Oryzias melastigma]|uniref:Uncharacterized protein n=1 Tax=Oryzias melastigma TaxID=30732 RepID=A0A834FLQ1_ORYME|nr:hypothetical protein FQA47_019782 [Oryzias melastigma]
MVGHKERGKIGVTPRLGKVLPTAEAERRRVDGATAAQRSAPSHANSCGMS